MSSGDFIFLEPDWLWLLPILFLTSLVWRIFSDVEENDSFSLSTFHDQQYITHPLFHLLPRASMQQATPWTSKTLTWLSLACLIIALSQPAKLGKPIQELPGEQDIVFIVDTSLSMVLRDYILNDQRIDRISLLKNLLKQFMQKLQGERISIIVFGETAHTLAPLTSDQHLLTSMINRISAGMVGRYNAIGDAISLAVREAGKKKDRTQILVLFTDAGQHTGQVEPNAAAELAAEAGIPLYTIAIGANTIEAGDKSKRSGLLYQTVDMTFLNALAKVTQGRSYQAGDSDTLKNIFSDITQNEQNISIRKPVYVKHPLYIYPLLAGLLLLTLLQFLYVRSNK